VHPLLPALGQDVLYAAHQQLQLVLIEYFNKIQGDNRSKAVQEGRHLLLDTCHKTPFNNQSEGNIQKMRFRL